MTRRIMMALAVCVVVLMSCTRRPLDIEADSVRIALSNDYSMPYRQIQHKPYHFGVMMYGMSDGVLDYEDFCGETGGLIMGIPGQYRTFVLSLDNDVTKLDGKANEGTLRAYTEEEDLRVKSLFRSCREAYVKQAVETGIRLSAVRGSAGFEGDVVIREPNEVFSGKNNDVVIPNLAISDGEYVILVSNRYALSQGRLTFYGVTHTERISTVQVFLTNLARSRYLVTDIVEEEPVSLTFFCSEINEEYLQGCFNYFGKLSGRGYVNTAYIVITDTSGGRYLFVVDVTNQIDGQVDNADMVIKLDFEVPNPKTGGTGFQPDVINWDYEWNYIHIG